MKSERRVRWGAVVGFLVTAACGGGTPSEMPDESAGGTGGTAAGTGGGTGTGGATGGTGGGPLEPLAPQINVQILNVPFRNSAPSVTVYSTVKNPPVISELLDDLEPLPECERTEVGSCTVSKCPRSENPPIVPVPTPTPDPTPPETIDAGAMTVEFEADEGPMVAQVAFSTSYADGSALFMPDYPLRGLENGSVTFAGGADVDGFTEPLQQPLFLLLTNPSVEVENGSGQFLRAVKVSRSAGITLNWERGAPGVSLYLQQRYDSASSSTDAHHYSLSCRIDSTLGTQDLPASLISEIPVGVEYDLFTTVFRERVQDGVDVRILHGSDVLVPERDRALFLRIVP